MDINVSSQASQFWIVQILLLKKLILLPFSFLNVLFQSTQRLELPFDSR